MNSSKIVSIIIPSRNEEKYIKNCLDSVLANDYPNDKLEILVCDGMSEDKTREIVEEYTRKYDFIKLLDNEKRTTPCAFNLGIRAAKGDLIMIMGAHAVYTTNYISQCVNRSLEFNADNVGGIWITKPRTSGVLAECIVMALTTPFGVGNAKYRTHPQKPLEVDTVFGGCYPASIFKKIGLFNENFKRSQDIELNIRLKKAGGKIFLFPEIKVEYFARTDFLDFIKYNFTNSFWVIYPLKFSRDIPFVLRHLIPLAFVGSLLTTGLLGIFLNQIFLILFYTILVTYFAVNIGFSWALVKQNFQWKHFLLLPLVFFSLHTSYGLGSLAALFRISFSKNFWIYRFTTGELRPQNF